VIQQNHHPLELVKESEENMAHTRGSWKFYKNRWDKTGTC